jgi:hypothetical protein
LKVTSVSTALVLIRLVANALLLASTSMIVTKISPLVHRPQREGAAVKMTTMISAARRSWFLRHVQDEAGQQTEPQSEQGETSAAVPKRGD